MRYMTSFAKDFLIIQYIAKYMSRVEAYANLLYSKIYVTLEIFCT